MSEEEVLAEAKTDVGILVEDVMDSLEYFAQKHHYEYEWVCEEFKKQLNERIKERNGTNN